MPQTIDLADLIPDAPAGGTVDLSDLVPDKHPVLDASPEELSTREGFDEIDYYLRNEDKVTPETRKKLSQANRLRTLRAKSKPVAEAAKTTTELAKGVWELGKELPAAAATLAETYVTLLSGGAPDAPTLPAKRPVEGESLLDTAKRGVGNLANAAITVAANPAPGLKGIVELAKANWGKQATVEKQKSENLPKVQKAAAETLASAESNVQGLADLGVKAGSVMNRLNPAGALGTKLFASPEVNALVASPELLSDEDWDTRFEAKSQLRKRLEDAAKGDTEFMRSLGLDAESLKAEGVTVDPASIQDLSWFTDPTVLIPGAEGFKVASAAGKPLLLAKTAGAAEKAIAKLRNGVADYVANQGERLVERGEKTSRTTAGVLAAGVGALTGAGAAPAAVAGVLTPPAMKFGGWLLNKPVAGAIRNAGAVEKAVLGTAKTVGEGVLAGVTPTSPLGALPVLAAAGSDTPEEKAMALTGPVLGGIGGTVAGKAAGRVRYGADALRESRFKQWQPPETQSRAYGIDATLDAAHERNSAALQQAAPDAANLVNWLRENVLGENGEIYLLNNDEFATVNGLPTGRPAPKGVTVAGPRGEGTRIYINTDAVSLGHEFTHTLLALSGDGFKKELVDSVIASYGEEALRQKGADYDRWLTSNGVKNQSSLMGGDIRRIAEEFAAELGHKVFSSDSVSGVPQPVLDRLLDVAALWAEQAGIASQPGAAKAGTPGYSPLGVGQSMEGSMKLSDRVRQRMEARAQGQTPPPLPPLSPAVPPVQPPATPPAAAAPPAQPPVAPSTTPPATPPPAAPLRNLRLTPEQQQAADSRKQASGAVEAEAALQRGNYPPETRQVFDSINESLNREQGEVVPVSIEYESVKPTQGGADEAKIRKQEQDAAYEQEALGTMPPDLRQQVEKTTVPVRWLVRGENVNLLAMSSDKVMANAHRIVQKAGEKNADLVPYQTAGGKLTDRGWRDFVADFVTYSRNQANGYAGDGSTVSVPSDYSGFLPERNPTYSPVALDKTRADFLNAAMALPPPKTARGSAAPTVPNIEAAKLATANKRPVIQPAATSEAGKNVYTRPGGIQIAVAETNPLRDQFAQRGIDLTGRELFQVTEELDIQRIRNPKPKPESRLRAPSTDLVRAGFMPSPLADDRTSGKAFKGFFSDVTKGADKYVPKAPWNALLDLSGADQFLREYDKHTGNFDNHIATSIPAYKDVQVRTGAALAEVLPAGAKVLDIAGSEGSWAKTISALRGGEVETVVLDPNPDMARFYAEKSSVPGSRYVEEAFLAGFEDEGKVVPAYSPEDRFDAIHEGMGFQFISPDREAQIAETKRLLKPDGVFFSEEKLLADPETWKANEAKKDREFKNQYYSDEALAAKQAVVKFQQDPKESKSVGMVDNMVTSDAFERTLRKNFKHVAQYWDSGNFKGYAASDSPESLRRFVDAVGDTTSDFSTVETPRPVDQQFMPLTDAGRELEAKGLVFDDSESGSGTYFLRVRQPDNPGDPLVRRLTGDKGAVVASISANVVGPGTASVGLISVGKEFQGQGVSDALYRELGARLQRDGITKLEGNVITPKPVIAARERVFGTPEVLEFDSSYGPMTARIVSRVDPKQQFMPTAAEYEKWRAERKKQAPTVAKKAPVSQRSPTGWIKPTGDYLSSEIGGSMLNSGDWHQNALDGLPADERKKFNLKAKADRLDAVKNGFVRVRYTGQTGDMAFEASAASWKRNSPQVKEAVKLATEHAGKISNLRLNLFDEKGNVTDNRSEQLFRLSPSERESAIAEMLSPTRRRELRFMPDVAAPTFYSKLGRVVENKFSGDSMPKEQFAAALKNAGIKAEELKWTGVGDLLEGPGRVTRKELETALAENEVRITESVKGGRLGDRTPKQLEQLEDAVNAAATELRVFREDAENVYGADKNNWPDEVVDQFIERRRAYSKAIDSRDAVTAESATSFEEYQEPGGTNYRELVVTLPAPEGGKGTRTQWQLKNESGHTLAVRSEAPTADRVAADRAKGYEWETATVPNTQARQAAGVFQSSHWEEPNVLGHVRFNDRKTLDGERVLHLEELQSDWHQKGRKEGYKPSPKREAELRKVIDDAIAAGKDATPEQRKAWVDAMNELQPETLGVRVPDAPFRTTWHELLLKRMLRQAAEAGYDYLSWTPGEKQAARYDLSKQVDMVQYDPKAQRLVAYKKNSGEKVLDKVVPLAGVEEYVGKEAAQKIADKSKDHDPRFGPFVTLENTDLKVGGRGMVGFYDKIVPEFLTKYGRKWGAKPTEITTQSLDRYPALPITEEMRKSVVSEGQPMFMPDVAALTEGLPPGQSRDYSWMNQRGRIFPVRESHGSDAFRLLNKTPDRSDSVKELWDRGYVRVTRNGSDLYAHREGGPLSDEQRSRLIQLAEESGFARVKLDTGEDYTTLWVNPDPEFASFMPETDELFDTSRIQQTAAKRKQSNLSERYPEALKPDFRKDDDGNFVLDEKGKPKAAAIEYELDETPLAREARKGIRKESEREAAVVKAFADRAEKHLKDALQRPEVAAGADWYSRFREKISKLIPNDADRTLFAHLLGASSARTPVADNYKQSVEAFNKYKAGDYQRHIDGYLEGLELYESGELARLHSESGAKPTKSKTRLLDWWIKKNELTPLKSNGKGYNANSRAVLRALAGTWLAETKGPKTPNFAGNLAGTTFEATIDVWAARFLHRIGNEGNTKRWRILPTNETGVSDGDFYFGQKVFRELSRRTGVKADSLQAVLWFWEKDHWAKQGWTRGEGAEKSDFNSLVDKTESTDEGRLDYVQDDAPVEGDLFGTIEPR